LRSRRAELIFEAVAPARIPVRRLLLVTFHFPPGEAPGALRWQKLAGLVGERGWVIDAICVHPTNLDRVDRARLAELPPGTRVYGVPVPDLLLLRIERWLVRVLRGTARRASVSTATGPMTENRPTSDRGPGQVRGVRRVVQGLRRAYFAWMDYRIHGAWADEAARVGERLLESAAYDAIVTCGPPHMAHDAGRRLARSSGLPLIVDLRDPWRLVQRLVDRLDSRLWYRLAAFYENRVMKRASLIVMNTTKAQAAMQEVYPAMRGRIAAVMNGYDDEKMPRSERRGTKFVIAYAGAVYLDRDPGVIFRAAKRLIESLRLTPDEIGIEFMGDVDSYRGASLVALARADGVGDFVRTRGLGSRDAALEFLSRATVLLSLPQDSDMAIPSKIFEYMQFDAWLLAVAQRGSATEQLLRNSAARVVAPGDVDGATRALSEMFLQHREGVRPARLADSVPHASRRAQALLLLNRIEALCQGPRP
jgi:hypothetical protein